MSNVHKIVSRDAIEIKDHVLRKNAATNSDTLLVPAGQNDWAKAAQRGRVIGEKRGRPGYCNPDYLVLEPRARFVAEAIDSLQQELPSVLDVGGRIQPYREYFSQPVHRYISVDPKPEGRVDIIAVGEYLPFKSKSFDVVICTQVLTYASDPKLFIDELHRVLKPNGMLIISTPSFFPMHEEERWRFLRGGLEQLLSSFSKVDIMSEGLSIAGLCRTLNVAIDCRVKRYYSRRILEKLVYAPVNYIGKHMDRFSKNSERYTANYCSVAIK